MPGEAGTLAYAATCQRDQTDRPVVGYANFCPYALDSGAKAIDACESTPVMSAHDDHADDDACS